MYSQSLYNASLDHFLVEIEGSMEQGRPNVSFYRDWELVLANNRNVVLFEVKSQEY